jgi:hypothetical protein
MTFEEFPNAIDRVLSRRDFVDARGEDGAKRVREKAKETHKLDFRTDEPIPQWAIDIMRDSSLGGYKIRMRILIAHQFDITDTNFSKVFLRPREVKELPPKPPPDWLVKHREDKVELAKRILAKYK